MRNGECRAAGPHPRLKTATVCSEGSMSLSTIDSTRSPARGQSFPTCEGLSALAAFKRQGREAMNKSGEELHAAHGVK